MGRFGLDCFEAHAANATQAKMKFEERVMGFEPTTTTLATLCSAN